MEDIVQSLEHTQTLRKNINFSYFRSKSHKVILYSPTWQNLFESFEDNLS